MHINLSGVIHALACGRSSQPITAIVFTIRPTKEALIITCIACLASSIVATSGKKVMITLELSIYCCHNAGGYTCGGGEDTWLLPHLPQYSW